ncbi:unnamed protein product, partial [Ixodes pacificus]
MRYNSKGLRAYLGLWKAFVEVGRQPGDEDEVGVVLREETTAPSPCSPEGRAAEVCDPGHPERWGRGDFGGRPRGFAGLAPVPVHQVGQPEAPANAEHPCAKRGIRACTGTLRVRCATCELEHNGPAMRHHRHGADAADEQEAAKISYILHSARQKKKKRGGKGHSPARRTGRHDAREEGPLLRPQVVDYDARHGRKVEPCPTRTPTLECAEENARHQQGGQVPASGLGGVEGEQGPAQGRAQHHLVTPPEVAQVAPQHLGERVAPEEAAQHHA